METQNLTSKPIVHQICGGLQIFFGLVIFACDIAFIVKKHTSYYGILFPLTGSGYGIFLGILIIVAGAVACSASCSPETGSCQFVSALVLAALALLFSFFGLIYSGIRLAWNSLVVSFIFIFFEIILTVSYVIYCSYFECCHRPRRLRTINTTTTVIQTQNVQPGAVIYTTQNQPAYPPQGQPYVQQYGGHYPPQYPPQNQPPSKSMQPPPYYNNEGMDT